MTAVHNSIQYVENRVLIERSPAPLTFYRELRQSPSVLKRGLVKFIPGWIT